MRPERAIALVLPLVCAACDWLDMPETQMAEVAYSSRAEVVRDRAIERGWIPSWLPEDATDIRERHDLDSNISQLTFRFDKLNVSECVPIGADAVEIPRKVMVEWWPAELRDDRSVNSTFAFRKCQGANSTAYLAVDDKGKRAYFWRP